MKRILSILICLLPTAAALMAQGDPLAEANERYRQGDLEGARTLLDKAAQDAKLTRSPALWVLRGFVYKDLYKANPQADGADATRDEAMASLYTGMGLDTAGQYAANTRPAYNYLAKTIYNDAVRSLNAMDDVKAVAFYKKYKESLQRLRPDTSFTAGDIDFGNALGTVYTKHFNENREQLEWYNKALAAYKAVLRLDSTNYGANYNLATLYYNRGVYNIQQIDAGNDIPSIQQIQEASRAFFTQALPYMLKAYHMNPARKETLLGLEGIHYSLQDEEQSQHYRHLYEKLEHDGAKPKEP